MIDFWDILITKIEADVCGAHKRSQIIIMNEKAKPKKSNPYFQGASRNDSLLSSQFKKISQNKSVNKVPDILPFDFFEKHPDKAIKNKTILFWGENVNREYIRTGDYGFFLKLEKKLRISIDFFKKIIFVISYYTPLKIKKKRYPNTCKVIKKIENNELKNIFVVLTNNNKGENIFNLPFFINCRLHEGILKNEKQFPLSAPNKKFCCAIISDASAFERVHFILKLSKYKKVDIFGRTIHTNSDNSKLPKTYQENPQFFQQYKFIICFENSFDEEYITEKLPNAMLGNAVPIYRGAPNVGDYFNTRSFINYEDYDSSYSKMIDKVIELDQDDKKYIQFLNQSFMTEQNSKIIKDKEKQLGLFLELVMV